ncbi:sensory transduction histidine kinase [Methanosarcina siciliae C2J]|uniref:Sensory transduction histidine kinase n=1 Tax=Methanosarcina siciliae C2J TaxID=1434118 RepID=A0A0E3PJG6_9EURY|nr:PAS domain S-box protein [Methanosarcina siciliae]AKB34788.1 sensory transduction histidine kinase [Methanosarcina siciliae C2J]
MKKIENPKPTDTKIQTKILTSILESSEDAFINTSIDGLITSWNKGAEQIYGYSDKEVLGKPISILESPTSAGEMQELTELIEQGDRIHHYETLQLRNDGKIISASLTLSPIIDASEKLISILIIARDITKSKETEEKLQKIEEKFRKTKETYNVAMEHTRQIIYDYDLRTDKCIWAGAIEEVTGYSFGEFQRLGKNVWVLNITQTNMNRLDGDCCDEEAVEFKEEFKMRKKDRTFICVENGGICFKDHEGHPYRTVGVLKDITTQKGTEATLAKIDILRKQEIHHRIKNNLQVISSLLNLQADQFSNRECIKGSEVLEAFRESQNRVISMALIHEELYKGGELDTLDLSSYIKELAENLFFTYRLSNTDISLKTDFEENLFFDMDYAVPLGIIVNELVSNSLKHAFAERDKGEISIKFCRENIGECRNDIEESKNEECKSANFILTVSDNGVGIPENLDFENLDSLGFQLIFSLVEQLDGEIELKRNNGTEFTIKFIVAEYNCPI